MRHEGREFLAMLQKVSKGRNPVGELYPVVIVEEENAKPSESGQRDEVFRGVGPVAEGGSEVHEPWNLNILFGRRGQHVTRREDRNQDQEKEQFDPFKFGWPSVGGHRIVRILSN
jgi:hypothetical protein